MPLEQAIEEEIIRDIWCAFLNPRLIISRITHVKSQVCILAYQPNFVARQFGLCQILPEPLFNKKREICLAGVPYSFKEIETRQKQYAGFADFSLVFFTPSFYMTKDFYTWWTAYYSKNMFSTIQIQQQLTTAFSFVQEHVKKGRFTHVKEIRAFQKYFEIVYNPMEIHRTVCEAARTLKEKFEKQLSKIRFPPYVKPEDRYWWAFKHQTPKFPNLPTSELALAFFPPYPWWFVCGNIFHLCENDAKKPAQRVIWAKCDLENFRGHLRYDLSAMSITSQNGEGAELKKFEAPLFFLNFVLKLTI